MSLTLPISVYVYDRRSRQYAFDSCLQCTVSTAPLPRSHLSVFQSSLRLTHAQHYKLQRGAGAARR